MDHCHTFAPVMRWVVVMPVHTILPHILFSLAANLKTDWYLELFMTLTLPSPRVSMVSTSFLLIFSQILGGLLLIATIGSYFLDFLIVVILFLDIWCLDDVCITSHDLIVALFFSSWTQRTHWEHTKGTTALYVVVNWLLTNVSSGFVCCLCTTMLLTWSSHTPLHMQGIISTCAANNNRQAKLADITYIYAGDYSST